MLIVIDNILHVKCTDSTEEKRCVFKRRGLRYHLLRSAYVIKGGYRFSPFVWGYDIAKAEETRSQTYREQLETPIVARHRVVVAGGGPSGVIAAAARSGADTLLIERYPFLGGNGTAGLMTCYNGFRNQRPPEALQTVRGIPAEYIAEIVRLGGAHYSTGLALRRISASAVIPRPGPVGTFMAPFFSRRGGSYQELV